VQAKVVDPAKVQEVKRRLLASYPTLEATTWEEKNRTLLGAIKVEKMIIVITSLLHHRGCGGLILGILNMMVSEKRKDIGILRSMGMSSRRVTVVFLGCGAFIGLVGAVGTVLGLLIAANVNPIKDFLARPPSTSRSFPRRSIRSRTSRRAWNRSGSEASRSVRSTLAGAISAAAAARAPIRSAA
jgi:ABC-type lipoprotein release transport system permease subunit